MAEQIILDVLRSPETKEKILQLVKSSRTIPDWKKKKYIEQLQNPTLFGEVGCYASIQTRKKNTFQNDMQKENRSMLTFYKVRTKGNYQIYYGLSGSDRFLHEGTRESRIISTSKRRFLSNEDLYITFYIVSKLTEVESLYIESNLIMEEREAETESECLNHMLSIPLVEKNTALIAACHFVIAKKLKEGNNVHAIIFDEGIRKLQRFEIYLQAMGPAAMEVKQITDAISLQKMAQRIKEFNLFEIGERFAYLDERFSKEDMNSVPITFTDDQLYALIGQLGEMEKYKTLVGDVYPSIFKPNHEGKLDSHGAKQKTELMIAVFEFFRSGKIGNIMKTTNQLTYGCLLMIAFIKANLFCSDDQIIYNKRNHANIRYNRYNKNDSITKTAVCIEADCDLTVHVMVSKHLTISTNGQLTKLGYIVQPRQCVIKYLNRKFICHCGENCLKFNSEDMLMTEYIYQIQADTLELWIGKFKTWHKITKDDNTLKNGKKKFYDRKNKK